MHYTNYFFNCEFCIGDCISHLNDGHVDAVKFTSVGHVDTAKFTVTETAMLMQQSLPCDIPAALNEPAFLPFRSIDTTLTTLSLPACNLTIFAMGQLVGLQCSVTRTTSLTLKISELLLNHFVRGWRFAMYSVCQRRQKVCTSF